MPTFATTEQIFDLIASELPENMFSQDRADNPDYTKRSVSSAEIRAYAQLIEDLYTNLKAIYDDQTILTASETAIPRWEKMLFAESQDSGQSYQVRVSNLVSKIRANGGISFQVIYDILSGLFVGTGLAFDLVTLNGNNGGAWILDESILDVSTYLSEIDPINYANLGCDFSSYPPGVLEQVQRVAYTYQVRVYGHANDALIARINQVCTDFEPARSTHEILNDFPGPISP